ncbi:Coatomer alpha subunit [Parasponia andersonii]|uniref:Coatomer alpha subunit n=1 Tax=Parasponia andersonii TaxID=3476 RepID=A0A2P5B6E3_PARAD|nr:Coatomer alpha subunit [Parasponia andersonii]
MDDGVGEEVTPLDAAECGHLQGKDNEYFLRPESCNLLESHEMVIPGESDYSTTSRQEFEEILDGKNVQSISNVNTLDNPYNSFPRAMDVAGVSVEELTVRNFDGSNLAIVGTSTNLGGVQTRQNQWQHLYQLGSGSGSGSSRGNTAYRDTGQRMVTGEDDVGYSSFPEFLAQKSCDDNHNEVMEELTNSENKGMSGNAPGSIRTKIISKSGFSEFFVKSTLKGKGIICKGPPQVGFHMGAGERNNTRLAGGTKAACNTSQDSKVANPSYNLNTRSRTAGSDCTGVNLREWLKVGRFQVNKVERLYVFRRILELVDHSHSQGVALQSLRPSYFKLLPSKKVKYLESPDRKEILQSTADQDLSQSDSSLRWKRPVEQNTFPSISLCAKKQKFSQNTRVRGQWIQFPTDSGFKQDIANASHINITGQKITINEFDEGYLVMEHGIESKSGSPPVSNAREEMTCVSEQLEEKWYTSPEELNGGTCTILSNIYSLGVFLFELLGHFDSDSTLGTAMSDLRHRILPPNFLSENPKEAGFCLWLLHPEPSSRPTTREILQSEVVSGLQGACAEELSSAVDQDDSESELLLHFLVSLIEQKQKDASKLVEDVQCLEADIEEVERRHPSKERLAHSCLRGDSSVDGKQNVFVHREPLCPDVLSLLSPVSNTRESRLMKNISQLESAYFSMRSKIQLPDTESAVRLDNELLRNRENWYLTQKGEEKQIPTDRVGAFFDGLCKYARYSKFEVRGVLRNGEFSTSSNVICSLSFDRDEDYFAAAGVSKKIKIFEFNALFNDSVDIHYPLIEMPNKSKLSCVCWNNYIKNYLASTDYDGDVKLWDASTGQAFSQYNEHEKRAWSVDFSQKNCLGTIRNIANVCCVQFSPHSTHLLAFGSADYRTYCYDLRYAKTPWCVLAGHDKAVSYVKFLDSETLISASTDNTLKLWDLKKSNSTGPSANACSLTFTGHTNEKNFVGLSVVDGYIACGSESNEVYAYYRSLPMPITSHKFGSIDTISGKETEDDNGQFVSSVCWRGKSDMVVAANSSGCIKVLEMV